MDSSLASTPSQELHIILELVPEDVYELDLAVTNALGRDLITDLQHDGYLVRLPDTTTKTRGGDFLIEIIQGVSTIAANVWVHKILVERALTDLGTLVTICQGVVPIVRHLGKAHTKRAVPGNGLIKITMEIDGQPVSVEAPDLEQADAALVLAQKYAVAHPDAAKKITSQSKTKIKGIVPKQQRRKRK